MADIRVTGSANFSAVTNGLKKIGAESANMSKGAGRAGQSILALGQGLEDFAAAGIRGAMNNIPQFIQMLGAGAGIAGGATIALVAINELVKGIDRFLDKRHAITEAENARGLGLRDFKSSEEELQKIDKLAAKAQESMRNFQEEQDRSEGIRGLSDRYFSSQSQLGVARSIFKLEQQGATEQDKKLAGIQEEIRLLNVRKNTIEDSLRGQKQVSSQIQQEIAKEQAIVDKWREMEGSALDARAAAIRQGLKTPVSPTKEITDPDSGATITANRSQEEMAAEQQLNLQKSIAALNASINEEELAAARIAAGVAQSNLEKRQKELAAAQQALDLAERTARVSTLELTNEQERLRIEEQRAQLSDGGTGSFSGIPILGDLLNGGINKLLEAANFNQESAPWMRQMNGASMLSSMGRIGGSGAEYNSAVATVNYQKQTLEELRKIARNTGKGSRPTYN